jgi:hypothetical protein
MERPVLEESRGSTNLVNSSRRRRKRRGETYQYMQIILMLGLRGLFSSRTPTKHHAHPLGCTHPTLETTALYSITEEPNVLQM